MDHCIIEGKRCTTCCQALGLQVNKPVREWIKYSRSNKNITPIEDTHKIVSMLIPISKRRAKKINPYIFSIFDSRYSYFKCKNLTLKGCGIYESRPNMCKGYPYYGKSKEQFLNLKLKPDYREDCTWFIDL